VHTRTAIGWPTLLKNSAYVFGQHRIGMFLRRGAARLNPDVVGATRDPEGPAHPAHTELSFMGFHKLLDFSSGPEKIASAFFSTALSCRSTSFSRFSRRISSSSSFSRPLPGKAGCPSTFIRAFHLCSSPGVMPRSRSTSLMLFWPLFASSNACHL